jgi:hypothetical protein
MTAARVQLTSGEPPINFAAHQFRAGNIAGAREDFEHMIAMLIAATRPSARLVAANPGDWGIDVLVGNLSGLVVVWQAKYFWPSVTRRNWSAIRESFRSAISAAAVNKYRVRRWVLCIPSSMDGPTAKWWDAWRARMQRQTGVHIELWHETMLRTLLVTPDAAHVRRHFYDPYQPGEAPATRPVHEPTDDHEHALFVRQLREAGHTELDSARLEYFNAELMTREITYKGVPTELAALTEADALAHSIWEGGFNACRQQHPDNPRLPGLHHTTMRELREAASFPTLLRAGPIQRCGMMHRLVESRRAGWVSYWREIAVSHCPAGLP